MFRKPWVKRPSERAPCTLSAIIALKASLTPLSFMHFSRWGSSLKMKWRENTPDCGATDEVFAVALMTKSMSPARTFWAVSGSVPSAALGNCRTLNLPPDSSPSFFSKVSAMKL